MKSEGRSPEAILTDALYSYLVRAAWLDPRHEGDTGGYEAARFSEIW